MDNLISVYKDAWSETTWFGKLTLFPILILCFPILAILMLGLK